MAEKEYIDKVAFNYAIREAVKKYPNSFYNGLEVARQIAHDLTAADVRPARRGKWIDIGDFISCSSCNATRLKEFEGDYGKAMRLDVRTNYCPNCGADMRDES